MKRTWLAVILFLLSIVIAFAQSERNRVTYQGFPGGLFTLTDVDACPATHLLTANNVRVLENGVIETRPGIYPFGGFVETKTIYNFFPVDESNFLSARSTGVWHLTTGGTATELIHEQGYQTQFVRFGNYVIFTTGSSLGYWDTASSSFSSISSAGSNIVCIHNDRVFSASGNILYETSIGSATDWAGGEAWTIELDNEQAITALCSFRGVLYIFGARQIFRMTGYSPEERRIEKFSSQWGCSYPKTIAICNLSGMGEGVVFVSSAFGSGLSNLCVLNESGIQDISGDTIRSFVPSTNEALGVYVKDSGEYWLFGTNAGQVLVAALGQPYSHKNGTRWPFTTFGGESMEMASTAYPSYTFVKRPGSSGYGFGYVTSYGSDVVLSSGTTTIRNITATVQTRHEDCGDPRYLKGWRTATYWTSGLATFTINQFQNYAVATESVKTFGTAKNKAPLYNWKSRLSLHNQIAPHNLYGYAADKTSLFRIDIDYVLGPKDE